MKVYQRRSITETFTVEQKNLNLKALRLTFLIFAFVYGAFVITDPRAFPDYWHVVAGVRMGLIVPLMISVILLSYHPKFYLWQQSLSSIVFYLSGAFGMSLFVFGSSSFVYYGAIYLIYVAGYFMIQLKWIPATFTGWSIFLTYVLFLIYQQPAFSELLIMHLIYFSIMNAFGAIGVYTLERAKRNQRYYESQLAQKNLDLQDALYQNEDKLNQLNDLLGENSKLENDYELTMQAIAQLHRVEERYQMFVKQTKAFVYEHDLKGKYTYVSDSIQEVLGYAPNEVIDKLFIYDFFPEDVREYYKTRAFSEIAEELKIYDFKNPLVTKQGKTIWVSSYLDPRYDESGELIGYHGCDMDITQRLLAEEEVTKFKAISDQSLYGSALADLEGKLIYVNEAFCNMHGYTEEELIGQSIPFVHSEEQLAKVMPILEDLKHGKGFNSEEVWHQRKDGSVFPTLMTGNIVKIADQPRYFSSTMLDMSVQKRLQTKLQNTYEALEASRNRLQTIMDHLPIGIAVNTGYPQVDFSYMNENFTTIYGTTKQALTQPDSFWEVVYPIEADRLRIKNKTLQDMSDTSKDLFFWEAVPLRREGEKTRYVNAHNIRVKGTKDIISTVIDVTEQVQKQEEILYISYHDYLTELPNRRYYQEALKRFEEELYQPVGVVMMDLNGLKLINDAFGHEVGNVALKQVAQALKSIQHQQHVLARVGGDEFVMLCPNSDEKTLEQLTQQIHACVSAVKVKDIKLSIAIGYFLRKDTREPLDQCLIKAENNMYKSKTFSSSSSRNDAIHSILQTLQDKYSEEKEHSSRVSMWCVALGKLLNLKTEDLKELEMAGLYHDIGKITIPDDILKKPAPLTPDEWDVMKSHTLSGYQILRAADRYSNLAEYALTHHERFDGEGYPHGLSGENIPLFSRIISVADAYEAMTSDRPYRQALKREDAIKELIKHKGSQFDPILVDLFISLIL